MEAMYTRDVIELSSATNAGHGRALPVHVMVKCHGGRLDAVFERINAGSIDLVTTYALLFLGF